MSIPQLSADALNRFARTVIQALVGYLVSLAAAHGFDVSAAIQDQILLIGTPLVAGVIAYLWRRFLDPSRIPTLTPPTPPNPPTPEVVA